MKENVQFQKDDYVACEYEGELLSAKILDVMPLACRIETYIDTIDDAMRLMQEMVVPKERLRPLKLCIIFKQ